MNASTSTLWSRDFVLFLAGWELTQFAGGLLRFAVPLAILLHTGDAALMGMVLAISVLPQVLITPVGGVLADRVGKRRFLTVMNLVTAAVVLGWVLVSGAFDVVPAAAILLLTFVSLESLFSPAFEAAVPALVPADQLVRANSVSFMFTLASSVGGPALGGLILDRWGLTRLLLACVALLVGAAVVKCFTAIPASPHEAHEVTGALLRTVAADLRDAARYVARGDRGLGKVLLIDIVLAVALVPLTVVVLPAVLLGVGLGEEQIGLAVGTTLVGGAVAVAAIGMLGARVTVALVRPVVLLAGAALAVTGLGLASGIGATASALVLVGGAFIVVGLYSAFAVILWAFIGERAPEHLMGKVFALALAVTALGAAAGNWLFGLLAERFDDAPGVVLLVAAGLAVAVGLGAGMAKHRTAPEDPQ